MVNNNNLYKTQSSATYVRSGALWYEGTNGAHLTAMRNETHEEIEKEQQNEKQKSKNATHYHQQSAHAWRKRWESYNTRNKRNQPKRHATQAVSHAVSSTTIRQAEMIHPEFPAFGILTSKRVGSLTGAKFKHERSVGFLGLESTHGGLGKSNHLTISQSNASKHASTLRAKQQQNSAKVALMHNGSVPKVPPAEYSTAQQQLSLCL